MSKLLEDKEFERNKKELLKRMMAANSKLSTVDSRIDMEKESYNHMGKRRYAWEYEIEEYRKKKNLEKFYKIGAISGIISLIITIIDKFKPIQEFTYTAFSHIFK